MNKFPLEEIINAVKSYYNEDNFLEKLIYINEYYVDTSTKEHLLITSTLNPKTMRIEFHMGDELLLSQPASLMNPIEQYHYWEGVVDKFLKGKKREKKFIY